MPTPRPATATSARRSWTSSTAQERSKLCANGRAGRSSGLSGPRPLSRCGSARHPVSAGVFGLIELFIGLANQIVGRERFFTAGYRDADTDRDVKRPLLELERPLGYHGAD